MRSRADVNNRANQMNPNNPAYWSSRGQPQPAAPPRSPGRTTTLEHAPPPPPAPEPPSTTK